ncbi:MAG TPA: DUF4388 domain-containing protein [Ktedonobacteraceae bacterium]|nr:DUF4388 domain-containing protein [Ktedonobacteraceae bacterium]
MSQQRETATDRLVSIIQLIQLGRKTGVLTAKRGDGITQEEGTITFNKGQITQTAVGRRRGSEALNWLTTWGNCRFTFVSSDPFEPLSLTPTSSREQANGTKDTDPRLRQQLSILNNQTGPLTEGESNRVVPYNPNTPSPTSAVTAAPFRTRQIDSALRVIENMGLSRTHRRLLLLIDGQRSILELVRLMARSEQEIASLLHDLEQATVIQIPGIPPPPFRR